MATNPIVISLLNLSAARGFRIDGVAAYDRAGRSVSSAGDVNGDGFDDVIIGASDAAIYGMDSGSSYVVFGKASGFATTFELSSLDGNNGFRVDGTEFDAESGVAVSSAGDINGDGFDDIVIGARSADPNGNGSGSSYVVFGKAGGFTPTMISSDIDGTNGFRFDGLASGDGSGSAVASAGDVNGDGIDDLIIGASGANSNAIDAGASYVVFGKTTGFDSALTPLDLNGSNGFRINGVAADDFSGTSVASAGDVNGDGFDDIIISAFGADPNGDEAGSTYVVFGTDAGFPATLNLSSLNGTNGFRMDGATEYSFSASAASAGDINGDGFDDIIIGSRAYGEYDNGASFVVFGKSSPFDISLNLGTLDGSDGFRIEGNQIFENTGQEVSSAGDVNGDGIDDIIIGAPNMAPPGSSSHGGAYVVFGSTAGFASVFNLSTLDGTNGFSVFGEAVADGAGNSVSAAGDVNGDGFDDIIVGAINADPNGLDTGASYIIFGRATDDITRTGTSAANRLFGGDYDDTLYGLGSNDILTGRLGDDRLIGSTGRDTLNGGRGRDILNGGSDSDRFRFTEGDSGQTAASMDRIMDFTKGAVNTGDRIDFTEALTRGGAGSGAVATADRASINQATGVATFAAGSGTTLADALSDIATRWTLSTDSAGEYALFQINNTGNYHIFVSDGVAGVTANDVLVQLVGVTSVGSTNITGGDLTILT